jgi:GNAT superfamily N-acetyltransferase
LNDVNSKITVRRATPKDSRAFLSLVRALANFEHLTPPSRSASSRLLRDVFKTKRISVLLALADETPVGCALYFFTYSSFLAKPTLYLEDLIVLEKYRGRGVGRILFDHLLAEASRRRCGRMEWSVLTWNKKAMKFYENLGAHQLRDWCVYRLDERNIAMLAREKKTPLVV